MTGWRERSALLSQSEGCVARFFVASLQEWAEHAAANEEHFAVDEVSLKLHEELLLQAEAEYDSIVAADKVEKEKRESQNVGLHWLFRGCCAFHFSRPLQEYAKAKGRAKDMERAAVMARRVMEKARGTTAMAIIAMAAAAMATSVSGPHMITKMMRRPRRSVLV